MAQTYQLIREQWVPQFLEGAFAFFSRPENLQAITPEWLDFRITGGWLQSCRPELSSDIACGGTAFR